MHAHAHALKQTLLILLLSLSDACTCMHVLNATVYSDLNKSFLSSIKL